MLICRGGQNVRKGTYWNLRNGRRIDVERDTVLPGGNASRYLRTSSGVLLLLGPAIGLIFTVLFPFISLGVVLTAAVRRMTGGIVSMIAKNLSFHWVPKNAHLTGKKIGKRKK